MKDPQDQFTALIVVLGWGALAAITIFTLWSLR